MDTSTLNVILNIVTILFTGGMFGAVLRFISTLKKIRGEQHSSDREDNRADFQVIIDELRNQRDTANHRVDILEKRQILLEVEVQGLRSARDLDPFPNWVVDTAGCYQFVNRAFEEHFLEPKGLTYRDAVGKYHADIWPEEFIKTLRLLDAAARQRADGTARTRAELSIPNLGQWIVTVHKFPLRIRPSNAVVAYSGYITEMDTEGKANGCPLLDMEKGL